MKNSVQPGRLFHPAHLVDSSRSERIEYILDVLWGQPIKLIQVVSTSEFHEYRWNDLDFIFFVPSTCCGASEVQT